MAKGNLIAEFPDLPHYRHGRACTLIEMAALERDRRRFSQSREVLDRARNDEDAALKSNPNYSVYRMTIRSILAILASCQAGQGESAVATATADQIAALGWDAAIDTYEAAGSLAHCAQMIGADMDIPQAKRADQGRTYSARCLALLRRAVNDAAALK